MAIAGILQRVSTLLRDAGDLVIPFTFVMLVDWIYVQRRRTSAEAFVEHPVGRRKFIHGPSCQLHDGTTASL